MVDIQTSGALTQLMLAFQTQITAGATKVLEDAVYIIWGLAVIDLGLSLVLNSLNQGEDIFSLLIQKTLKYSFISWLVNNWATGMNLTKQFFDTFQYIGIKAAGGELNGFNNPSAIGEQGIYLCLKILDSIFRFSTEAGVLGNLGLIFLKIILCFLIIGCFFWMAIQIFLVSMEFYLTSVLTSVLVPFSVNRHTGFIGEKAIGAIVSLSIKAMVLQFILCITIPITKEWGQINIVQGDLIPVFRALLGCIAIAFLTWKAPEYAQGLLTGSPSFSAGEAVGGARAAVSSVSGAAVGTVASGLRVAGFSQAAMNATGGRNSDGSVNYAGTARNMGAIFRQAMPDRQAEMQSKVLMSNFNSFAREAKMREAQKAQTQLQFDGGGQGTKNSFPNDKPKGQSVENPAQSKLEF